MILAVQNGPIKCLIYQKLIGTKSIKEHLRSRVISGKTKVPIFLCIKLSFITSQNFYKEKMTEAEDGDVFLEVPENKPLNRLKSSGRRRSSYVVEQVISYCPSLMKVEFAGQSSDKAHVS